MREWLDRSDYPFREHYIQLPMGRMHYLDEGQSGHALVLVHGNPAWSYTYRALIRSLSPRYRCIAPDHIGFGLSEKPGDWEYLPEQHAENLERLLGGLGADSITLLVADWGGPIGLAYAVRHPERIASLVITNTWMWPVRGDLRYQAFSLFMGGPLGRALIKRYNFFVTVLMRQMFRAKLSPSVYRHYVEPLRRPKDRKGCWVFPREIIGSSDWLGGLWSQRASLAAKPALILWGMRDRAFGRRELETWRSLFVDVEVHELARAGHFVAEDRGEALCPVIGRHLQRVLG